MNKADGKCNEGSGENTVLREIVGIYYGMQFVFMQCEGPT